MSNGQVLTPTRSRFETRARLLEAACEVIAEVGYEAASVEMICERASFSRGAFYSNFTSKDALFGELVQSIVAKQLLRAEQFIGALTKGRLRSGPIDAIRALSMNVVDGRAGALILAEMRMHAMRDPQVGREYRRWREGMLTHVQAIISRMISAYGLSITLPLDRAAAVVFRTWQDVAVDAVIDDLDADDMAAAVAEAIVDLVPLLTDATAGAPAPTEESELVRVALTANPREIISRVAERVRRHGPLETVQTGQGSVSYRISQIDVDIYPASDGTISTLSYGPDFPAAINGVRIGDHESTVNTAMGAAQRTWPVPHTAEVRIWDEPTFFRVDIDPVTTRVVRMWR